MKARDALKLVLNHCEEDARGSVHNPHLVALAEAVKVLRKNAQVQQIIGTWQGRREEQHGD